MTIEAHQGHGDPEKGKEINELLISFKYLK
jgi:hypothetical protein